jgi:hypothetical protein
MGITAASPVLVTGRAAVPGSPAVASLPPNTIGFDLAAAAVSRWDAPPQAAPADAVINASSILPVAPPLLARTGKSPSAGDTGWSQPALPRDAILVHLFAEVDEQPFGSLPDDLTPAARSCDVLSLDSMCR